MSLVRSEINASPLLHDVKRGKNIKKLTKSVGTILIGNFISSIFCPYENFDQTTPNVLFELFWLLLCEYELYLQLFRGGSMKILVRVENLRNLISY